MSNRVSPPSRLFPIAFAVLAAATAGAVLTPAAHAAAQALSVLVTNTDANPIPATLVGPASVSIAGTPSVSVAGTPSVVIASDGREPVQAAKVFFGSPDTFDCGQIYQVPAGKRLVVQYVGVEAFGLTSTNKVAVRLNASSEAAQLNIPMTKAFGALHVASEQVLLFTTTDLRGCAFFAEDQGNVVPHADVSFSGYLEDIQ
jgi:hypothetical protein